MKRKAKLYGQYISFYLGISYLHCTSLIKHNHSLALIVQIDHNNKFKTDQHRNINHIKKEEDNPYFGSSLSAKNAKAKQSFL